MKQPKCTEHQMHLHFIKRRAGHQLISCKGCPEGRRVSRRSFNRWKMTPSEVQEPPATGEECSAAQSGGP